MIKNFLPVIILLLSTTSFAQTPNEVFRPTPLYVDQNGKISDNWIDPDYSPVAPYKLSFSVGTSFLPGKVFLKDGTILDGLLKYTINGRKLLYKSRLQYHSLGKRIKANKCLGFTILKDTFTVVKNFTVVKKRGEFSLSTKCKLISFDKPEFAEVLGESNGCSIYKFIDITNNGQNVNTYFLMHNKEDNTIVDVSEENKKWRTAIQPMLSSGGMVSKPEDIKLRTFFREQNFNQLYQEGKKLLFSPLMVEVKETNQAMYQAELNKKNYWQLTFCSMFGDTVMKHTYKSILPYKKYGTSTYYYPNGFVRKCVRHKNGSANVEKRFHPNGHLHYDIVQNTIKNKTAIIDLFKKALLEQPRGYWYNGFYIYNNPTAKLNGNSIYENEGKLFETYTDKEITPAISKNFTNPEEEKELEVFYTSVCDSLGNNILDAKGNGTEKIYDSIRHVFCYNTFVEHQLNESYYLNKAGEKVYLYCNRPLKANSFKVSSQLNTLKQQLLMGNWDCFPQGTVLVRFVIDKEGVVRNTELINVFDEKLKMTIISFVLRNLSNQTYKAAKHQGEKVYGDIIVPIYIGVKGYGPIPSANSSLWMMHHHQMHMMKMQHNFTPPVRF